jgi:hypothetical protein
VDFGPSIAMPPEAGTLANLSGVLLGGLADIPLVMNLFERISRKAMQKTLARLQV